MHRLMVGGHLDVVAEHVVVPDLQRRGRRSPRRSRLQPGDHAARLVAQRAASRRARRRSPRARSRRRASSSGSSSASAASSMLGEVPAGSAAIAASAAASSAGSARPPSSVARSAPPRRARRAARRGRAGRRGRAPAATARAACRRRRFSACAQRLARAASRRRRTPTASSRASIAAGIGQRRDQPLGEQPRAAAGHRAVDRGEQRAVAAAGQRAHQFEIGARRRIDEQRRAGRLALAARRAAAARPFWVFSTIVDDAPRSPTARRGEKAPKPSERRDAEEARRCAPRRAAESNSARRLRRRRRAPSTSKTGFSSGSWNTGSATISSRGSTAEACRPAAGRRGLGDAESRRSTCRSRPARRLPLRPCTRPSAIR